MRKNQIPRCQRYISRPSLDKIFDAKILKNKQERNIKIKEAVKEYGYSQKEASNYLKLHYSTISRLIKENDEISKSKT